MNIIDMVIISFVCICLIRGAFRGLSRELASIIGVMCGFYGAFLFYSQAAKKFPALVPKGPIADMAAFALIFCGVVIVMGLLGTLVRYILGITMMGWIDRLLGALFGAVKGVLVMAVLIFFLTGVGKARIPETKGSMLYGYATVITDSMADVVSTRFYSSFYSKIKEINKKWMEQKR